MLDYTMFTNKFSANHNLCNDVASCLLKPTGKGYYQKETRRFQQSTTFWAADMRLYIIDTDSTWIHIFSYLSSNNVTVQDRYDTDQIRYKLLVDRDVAEHEAVVFLIVCSQSAAPSPAGCPSERCRLSRMFLKVTRSFWWTVPVWLCSRVHWPDSDNRRL